MKKLAVVMFMFIVLLNGVVDNEQFSLLDYFSGDYTVYTSQSNEEDCVDLGFCYMNSKPVTNSVIGESLVIENLEVGDALNKLKARVVKTEYLEDGTTVIYAISSLIKTNVDVDGKKVNLQIANKDNRFVVGWPLILGSY